MENQEIRTAAKQNGVTLWRIAEALKISEATMTRMLRRELNDHEKDNILTIISDLSKGAC